METWDAIRARRNVRSYRTDPVPAADLDRIAEAGWRAPSASNRQHWDFIIVTDRDQLRALSTVWHGAGHIAGAAAAIALVVPVVDDDHTRLVDTYDLGQATYAMMIAAADLGIGTGHSSVGDQEQARKILGVPDDHDVAYLIGVGYPADRPLQADRQAQPSPLRRGHPARPLVAPEDITTASVARRAPHTAICSRRPSRSCSPHSGGELRHSPPARTGL